MKKATQKVKFVFGRVENTVGNGENGGSQHFLLSPRVFKNLDCVVKSSNIENFVISIFSCSHNVFKSFLLKCCVKLALCENTLEGLRVLECRHIV